MAMRSDWYREKSQEGKTMWLNLWYPLAYRVAANHHPFMHVRSHLSLLMHDTHEIDYRQDNRTRAKPARLPLHYLRAWTKN